MKEKFLPWFLLFCALGLSGTAAYYSVVGLSVVFVGVALPVIEVGSFPVIRSGDQISGMFTEI